MSGSHASEAVVDRVADLLHRQIGLRPEPTLRGRLRRCIRDAAAAHNQDIHAYLHTLIDKSDALQGLVDRVTVQETAFFRHPEHFDALVHHVFPGIAGPVTIWSAGCANGQEAFSIAMLLDEHGIDGAVIATDLSSAALQRTRTARYSGRELAGLSPERIRRHFTRAGNEWGINRSVRDRVSVVQYNLLDAVPGQMHGCHVVFCRNVLIYFSPEQARDFLDRVADAAPASALFLGSAETMWPWSDRFETVQASGSFFYRPGTRRAPVELKTPSPETSAAGARRTSSRRSTATRRPRLLPAADRPASEDVANASDDSTTLAHLTLTGQLAAASGDNKSAVVAFRKCTYLAPNDPATHLHLALALDADGDHASARRAYAVARRALVAREPGSIEAASEGYAAAELFGLLDSKLQIFAP